MAMIRPRQHRPAVLAVTKSKGSILTPKATSDSAVFDLRDIENLDEDEAQDLAAERLKEFCKECCGSVLRAWAHVFDSNNDQRISRVEFQNGMRKLGYMGDCYKLFNLLDKDASGEITLEEIDFDSDRKWRQFRKFCVKRFSSSDDFLQQLSALATAMDDLSIPETNKKKPRVEALSKVEFLLGMINSGWPGEDRDLDEIWITLRDATDEMLRHVERDGPGLDWFGIELRRAKKKRMAKQKSQQWFALKSRQGTNPFVVAKCFENFKTFMRKKHGNLIRAWRQDLTVNDAMSIAKVKFLREAAKLGFSRDAKDLWRALDKDESGTASVDELDPVGAETLAHFKVWVDTEFGGIRNAFRQIDEDNTKSITIKEFDKALRNFNFPRQSKALFQMLDKDANGKLEMEDLIFLEKWQPLEFLLMAPDHQAKQEFRELLLAKMGKYLKAWKRILDKDATNRCNWYEFQDACKEIGFRGNMGGAWRAFDEDLSGYITLKELDEQASAVLLGFRRWAIQEFGSVRQLFQIFDKDGSNSLSFLEWRGALRVYGYDGPSRELFQALDVDQEGTLSMKEVDFLDDWDLDLEEELPESQSRRPSNQPRPTSPAARRAEAAPKGPHTTSARRLSYARRASLQESAQDEDSSDSSEPERPKNIARRWRVQNPMGLIRLVNKVIPKKKPRFYMSNGVVMERSEASRDSTVSRPLTQTLTQSEADELSLSHDLSTTLSRPTTQERFLTFSEEVNGELALSRPMTQSTFEFGEASSELAASRPMTQHTVTFSEASCELPVLHRQSTQHSEGGFGSEAVASFCFAPASGAEALERASQRDYLTQALGLDREMEPVAPPLPARTRPPPGKARQLRVAALQAESDLSLRPSLDQLLTSVCVGPAMLSTMLLRDRGLLGSMFRISLLWQDGCVRQIIAGRTTMRWLAITITVKFCKYMGARPAALAAEVV
ncbi:unnamed protein product [Symbiodinium sp. CCMP2592]|nr:unnamed protein product [Symbiodinium sp. CCMP2592]